MEILAAEIHSELERHVEARQRVHVVKRRSRQIMNRVARGGDQCRNFVEPHLTRIKTFASAFRAKTDVVDGEDDRLEHRGVLGIKGTVDEYVSFVFFRLDQ